MSANEAGTTVTALEHGFLLDWLQRYVDGWNAHDVEGILSLYTEDVVYIDPSSPGVLHGQAEVRRFLSTLFGAYGGVTAELLRAPYISLSRTEMAAAYRFRATMRGDWAPQQLAATGAPLDFEGVSVWQFRGELASSYTTYCDMLQVARQLGVLPPIGSFGDRLATQLQHLQARVQRRRNALRGA